MATTAAWAEAQAPARFAHIEAQVQVQGATRAMVEMTDAEASAEVQTCAPWRCKGGVKGKKQETASEQ